MVSGHDVLDHDRTIALLDTIQDAFNRHDVETILAHFSADCEWLMARGPEPEVGRLLKGKSAIGAVLRARFAVIPDMRWEDMRHVAFGNRAMSEWTVRGTGTDGTVLDALGCDLWTLDGDKVKRKDTYWKFIEPAE